MHVVHPHPRASAWALAVLLLLTALPARAGLDLRGVVRDTSGAPLPGAHVYVYTAAPRVGPGILCPSCYPDCDKHRETGPEGRFAIPGLADSLIFRVLVTAKGHEPRFVKDVDPGAGAIEVRLARRTRAPSWPPTTLWGVVKDPRGGRVPGAVVQSVDWRARPEDPVVVTDERGEFALSLRDPFWSGPVRVTARNLAPRVFQRLRAGQRITLRLTHGATIIGRLVRAGEPVRGATVRLRQWNHRAEPAAGSDEIATDADGNFTFVNVVPRESMFVSVPAVSLAPGEAVPIRPFASAGDDSSTVAASLEARPALRLLGHVRLTDGRPASAAAGPLVARRRSGEEIRARVDSAGRFDCLCVPPGESIHLMFGLEGYHVSPQTARYSAGDPFGLWLAAGDTLDDVEVVLDPGLVRIRVAPRFDPARPPLTWPFGGDPRALLERKGIPQAPMPTPPEKGPPK